MLIGLSILQGCGTPTDGAAPTRPHTPTVTSADDADGARTTFLRRWQAKAQQAAAQQRWADAVWAWDVVLTLTPKDRDAQQQRARAAEVATEAASQRSARAAQARQRGDADAAMRLYLEVLALTPEDRGAADALRDIERQRSLRSVAGAARAMPAPTMAVASPPATPVGAAKPATESTAVSDKTRSARNEQEHSAMLAAQGDVDAAIALLQPLAAPRSADAALRQQLADYYVRQSELRVAKGDRNGAIASLRQGLQLNPAHATAQARLKALQTPPAKTPAAASAPAR